MHVCLVGPINICDLARLLDPPGRDVAARLPRRNVTAPGTIAKALVQRGHRVSVVTRTQDLGPLTLIGDRLTVVRVDGSAGRLRDSLTRWNGAITTMTDAVRTLGPDVVHANWAYEGALAAARSGAPCIVTVRDAPLTVVRYYPRPDRWVRMTMPYELLVRHSGRVAVTAVSPYLAAAWKAQTRWPGDVAVVPNIAPAPDPGPSEPEGCPTFVEIADAGRRKNIPTLLRAFAAVRDVHPDARLALLGSGLADGDRLAAWARARGLDKGVEFVGMQGAAEVRRRLRSAVAHVHLAREETFGNTLVEAMSAGTPVIAGENSGSVPWVLGDQYGANLVDVTSSDAAAARMLVMLRDPVERRRLATAGSQGLSDRFSAGVVSERYECLYRQVAAGASVG